VVDNSPLLDPVPPARIDQSVPHSARIWNYWLGGRDNYPADQEAGDRYVATFPGIVDIARHSRAFLARAVRYLVGEAGIRQFLDVGTGLPTVDNTHEVAQRVAPECRIVYVDNDPLVLVHARALLTSAPAGVTAYIDADLHDPDAVLAGAARTLDFSRPVGITLLGIMGHIVDDDEAQGIVRRLLAAVPAGSYLVLNDGVNVSEARDEAQQEYNDNSSAPYRLRSPARIARFFDGLELLEPGVVPVSRWRPEPSPFGVPAAVEAFCGVARKP
jgi:S-adenosyl methyltransferase